VPSPQREIDTREEKNMIIKRFAPVSCAKITGTLYAIVGLLSGAVFSLVSLAGGFASTANSGAGIGALVGTAAIVVFPILYGFMGFITTLIGAWLYNVLAGMVGGIQMDVE
jgi:hypothetical protein